MTDQKLTDFTVVPTHADLAKHHASDEHRELVRRQRLAESTKPRRDNGPRGGATPSTAREHTEVSLAALEATATIDAEQSQLRMVPAGNGILYSVQADGRLLYFRHLGWQTGDVNWANGGSAMLVNSGWNIFTSVLAAADGQIFGLAQDGSLRWYKHTVDLNTNVGTWAAGGAAVIGQGFDQFARVFGGWDGVIYAVDGDGGLWWFRYLAGDGTTGPGAWANGGQGLLIKADVKLYPEFIADQGGVLYGVRHGAELHWFRHDGGGVWANGGDPVVIGQGWTQEYQRELIAQGGVLHTVYVNRVSPPGPDHELYWYRLLNWQNIPLGGTASWTSQTGRLVGTGWTTCRTANLQGYTARRSVAVGSSIGVAVSSTTGSYSATVQRLDGPLPAGGTTVWGPNTFPGRLQFVQANYRRAGCGWSDDFAVTVPSTWRSGLYAVTLAGPLGMLRYAPFVVKPTTPTAKLAVLMPQLTHNAYNTWGGHSQYTWDDVFTNRYVTLQRPASNFLPRPPGHIDARWFSDLLLLRWLTEKGFSYDCYQDVDLHESATWLGNYKALVLCTHPEYWTVTMRNRVIAYLAAGGRVIYTGGNGMYEPVDLADGNLTAVHRDPNGNRVPYRDHGLPESDVLGVAWTGSFLTFEPYRVVSDHPFLAGSGLSVNSQFGQVGYNGKAGGWETDGTPGGIPGVQLIARSLQPGGADMVFFDKGNGAWVFSVGSLTFNGALATDAAQSKILQNAVTAALV
jgi:hypothetical protein